MADQPTPPPVAPSASPSVPRTAPIAIWSPVLAILFFTGGWLFTAIPAVICGHIARSKIRKSGGALRGIRIATAGLIVGYIGVRARCIGDSVAGRHDQIGPRTHPTSLDREKGNLV